MFTDFDKSIYNILKYIDSNNNFGDAISKFNNNYEINYLNFIITQMVNDDLIDGVVVAIGYDCVCYCDYYHTRK